MISNNSTESGHNTVLFSDATYDTTSDLGLLPEKFSTCVSGTKFNHVRYGIVKKGIAKSIELDSSKTQLVPEIKFNDRSKIKTTREFVKTAHNK